MNEREDRELGPEMKAEQWIVIGGDSVMWMHPPSHRCVVVSGPNPRKTANYDCTGIVALHGEPSDPTTPGYSVKCYVADEGGEPVAGNAFWVESYAEAVKRARSLRQTILDEGAARDVTFANQLTLDDVLAGRASS